MVIILIYLLWSRKLGSNWSADPNGGALCALVRRNIRNIKERRY